MKIIDYECEECGRKEPAGETWECGEWLGTPGNGYVCTDRICPDCRSDEHS